jgi:preprotein translocase subunit SecY
MRTEELITRIAITLGALLLYRLGTYIPLPGIDAAVWEQFFRGQAGGVLGSLDLTSGGGIHRLAVFALNIVPYISAAVILQLATIVSARLRALARAGERGLARFNRGALYLTIALAALQALGIAVGLQNVRGVVAYPGGLFIVSTVITLTGGTLFLVWLSREITQRGIGNGIALLLFAGIVAELPAAIARMLEAVRQGLLAGNVLLALAVITAAVIVAVVMMERARRRIPTRYAQHQGSAQRPEGASELSLKLNAAGIIPVLLASWVLQIGLAAVSFFGVQAPSWIGSGRLLYLALYAALIVLAAFFYTALVLDPEEAAERLGKLGGAVPGVAPGEATAAFLDGIVSRTTLIGAGYLAAICLLPEILIGAMGVPAYVGGPSLLIVVCTALDLDAQVRGPQCQS